MLLVIAHDITKANSEVQDKLNAIYDASNNDGGPYMYAVVSNVYEDIEPFRHEHQNMFEYLTGDGTMLKTIVRSNPGLVLLNKGTVLAKWHYNDIPSYDEIKAEYLK